jgi:hypothetical protein
MTNVVIDEPTEVKLRHSIQDLAVPAFSSKAEVQAWLAAMNQGTTAEQIQAMKDKITALTITAAMAQRQ